VIFNWKNIFI